jgi:hypothetical protein
MIGEAVHADADWSTSNTYPANNSSRSSSNEVLLSAPPKFGRSIVLG